METFLQAMGIFGGFPLEPVSDLNVYKENKMFNSDNGRGLTAADRRKIVSHNSSWNNVYGFEVSLLRIAWCCILNTIVWILILAIFFAVSYGNNYSGFEYLFPLNVSSR